MPHKGALIRQKEDDQVYPEEVVPCVYNAKMDYQLS